MQEVEKLKVLQSEREALKLRTKGKEVEKKAENHTETVCPEYVGRHSFMTTNGRNWSARSAVLSLMATLSIAVPNGVHSTTTSV